MALALFKADCSSSASSLSAKTLQAMESVWSVRENVINDRPDFNVLLSRSKRVPAKQALFSSSSISLISTTGALMSFPFSMLPFDPPLIDGVE